MPETQKPQETTVDEPAAVEEAPKRASKEPDNRVAVELNPDFEFEGDKVHLEVGSYDAIELSKGDTVKVSPEFAYVLDSVPTVRRVS